MKKGNGELMVRLFSRLIKTRSLRPLFRQNSMNDALAFMQRAG